MTHHTLRPRLATRIITFLGALALAGGALAAPLKIGVVPGIFADSVEAAAKEAKKQGLDVQVVEFTDWATPNVALDAGDIDLNYYQNSNYLANAVRDKGFKITSVQPGKRFDELKPGARIAVANDPVNQGRGLLLLEKAGLIKLRDGVGTRGNVRDIVGNPRNFKLVEIEGPQLVRALDDVDLAQGYPAHFVNAGKPQVAGSALLYSGIHDDYFAIRFVTRENNASDARVRKFVEIYQNSPAVKAQIARSFANDDKLYSLPWLKTNNH